ncbi:structure-specific endonuclease subunit SLX4 [Bacillus rossius redtenbacheri]|uniref:structure-specific endonuclease subunit SLX4 n=1 Tax=Bacillus rossius redtenbacheri TaxID=93214 RepID=UPI002FDEEBB3
MTDEARRPSYRSHVTKRSKLTLSLKSDSFIKCSDNVKTGHTTLRDELSQHSTRNVGKSLAGDENNLSVSCETRTSAERISKAEEDAVSVESRSVKLEEDAAPNARSHADEARQVLDVSSSSDEQITRGAQPPDLNECSLGGNLFVDDTPGLKCSLQATCNTEASVPAGGVSRAEKDALIPNCVDKEGLLDLEVEEGDGARKVETWLDNQDFTERRDAGGDPGPGAGGRSVTSEFFSEGTATCPLCWRRLERKATAHLKLCAARHGVGTQQLLEALELQRRQAGERSALGLPPGPVARPPAHKKGAAKGDASLDLALALSVSLREAEEREERELGQCLVEPGGLSPGAVGRQRRLLETFGFTSSRPALPPARPRTGATRARQRSYPLLSRSRAERERLVTEKVAIVLMGEEGAERAPALSRDAWRHVAAVSSRLLLSLRDAENRLWEMARDASECTDTSAYYVRALASHISPCKVAPGARLRRLSQMQGRASTPKQSSDSENVDRIGLPVVSSGDRSVKTPSQQAREKLKKVRKLLDFSPATQSPGPGRRQRRADRSGSLSADWASVLNKRAMSDVTVLVAGGREIPAHKLVLYARCPALLCDLIKEESGGTVRELLSWADVPYGAALAFLEFLYCGTLSRALRLGDELSGLKELARRYQVVEITRHLAVMRRVRASVSLDGGYGSNTSTACRAVEAGRSARKADTTTDSPDPRRGDQKARTTPEPQKLNSSCDDVRASQCYSPDMFDETTLEEHAAEDGVSQGSRAFVDCLLSLINKADAPGSDKTDEMDVCRSGSKTSGDGQITKESELHCGLLGGSSENIFLKKYTVSENQNNGDINESLSSEILSTNIHAQTFTETNVEGSRKCSLTPNAHDKNFVSSVTAGNTSHLPIMDLTQDSSDEEMSMQRRRKSNKINSVRAGEERDKGSCSPGTCEVSPLGKEAGPRETPTKRDGPKESDRGGDSEPDVAFVDNVWDDFDDLGVVPNLLFYSSPPCKPEVFGPSRDSGRKCRSRGAESSPGSGGGTRPEAGAPSPGNADCSFRNLLEDSLGPGLDSSALWRGESTGAGTPEEPRETDLDVTPLPDYSTMKTPLLKKELLRFGLKPLKRNQAKLLLRHIYNEMHPFAGGAPPGAQHGGSLFREPNADTVVPRSPVKRPASQPCCSDREDVSQGSSCGSLSSDSSMAEERIHEVDELSQAGGESSEREPKDFGNAVRQYIKDTPELYERILRYEPIWLEELQANLKAQKLKFNLNQLMDYLDEQCVTFRTAQGQRSRARRKERKRAGGSPGQPIRGRPRKRACTQPS